MKIKHSKYKNTGILFELLTRQITSDTISGGDNKALTILKKYFNSKSELLKEYKIYNALSTKKYKDENKATILVDTLIEAYNKLSKTRLRREKYNLIKEIKNNYNVTNFFNSKINNYKVMASIFNLLENKEASVNSILKSKVTLLENIIGKKTSEKITKKSVKESLESFYNNCDYDFETFVIDNQSEPRNSFDESIDMSKKQYGNLKYTYIEDQSIRGLTGAWNDGIKQAIDAGCDIIILSGDDINYNKSIDQIRNLTSIESVIATSSPFNPGFADENLSAYGRYQRSFGKIRGPVGTNFN